MREAIEKIIAELEEQRKETNQDSIRALDNVRNEQLQFLGTLYRGQYQGMGMAINKLKEVLRHEEMGTGRCESH